MEEIFEFAAGSIVGTDHLAKFVWKNNQDAFAIRSHESLIVGVVADGCGEGTHSEFGARLGANMLAHRLAQLLFGGLPDEFTHEALQDVLELARVSMIGNLLGMVQELGQGSQSKTVVDHLLFTLQAFVITPTMTYVLGIGDGVHAVNGEVVCLGPFEKNEPPYLAYGGIIKSSISPKLCKFTIHKMVPTESVSSVLIGTDGVIDLIAAENKTLPGKKELVGPLSQFWTTDHIFKSPNALRGRLNQINNSVVKPNWEEKYLEEIRGHLKDDTTLVVARRKKQTLTEGEK